MGAILDRYTLRAVKPRKATQMNDQDLQQYRVVINHEEQYSLWPLHKENAKGWRDVGVSGLKEDCLAHIGQVWTDMRPLSLRKLMVQNARIMPISVSVNQASSMQATAA